MIIVLKLIAENHQKFSLSNYMKIDHQRTKLVSWNHQQSSIRIVQTEQQVDSFPRNSSEYNVKEAKEHQRRWCQ